MTGLLLAACSSPPARLTPPARTEAVRTATQAATTQAVRPTLTTPAPPASATTIPTPMLSPTLSPPPPIPSAYPTPAPGLATPVEAAFPFLIHQVRAGESLAQLAITNRTTPAVLLAVNGRSESEPLLAGQLLVIPAGLAEARGLPSFQIAYLTRPRSLADLAEEYQASPEAIRRYNALGPGDGLPVGRWLILPRPE